MINVTILIPAYNESATIIELLETVASQQRGGLRSSKCSLSTMGLPTARATCSTPARICIRRLIKRTENGGKGAAVVNGLAEATGDYILFQDADLEYDPGEYSKLFAPVSRFGADVVIGSRFIAPEYTRVSYFWHKFGNRVLTFIFNIVNNTTFTDIYSCYLMYRRDLVDPASLKAMGWDQHAEILSIAVANGKAYYEVPVSYHGRGYEEGKKIRAHHGIGVILTILRKRLFR